MRRLLFVNVLLAMTMVLSAGTALAAPKPTLDRAVDELIARGYPQAVCNRISSLGTSPIGYRLAGTSADNAAARYIADQMRAIGLSNVRLERVPLDAWDVRGASVSVDGRLMTASQFAGAPGTQFGGVTGDLVYVRDGSAAAFDAAGDVRGKVVLVDSAMSSWWFNLPAEEAAARGAKAAILTYNVDDPTNWGLPSALGSFDYCGSFSAAPLVYVSWQDGDWLRQRLADGPATATVKSDVHVTWAEQGGHGYNVVGELVGSDKHAAPVLLNSHHDGYFHAVIDNASGVAVELTLAKALKMSGAKLKRTVRFYYCTAEESGYGNAYYDWGIGSWWAVSKLHPSWGGSTAWALDIDAMGTMGASKVLLGNPETVPWLQAMLSKYADLVPEGGRVQAGVGTGGDCWRFEAAGIPTSLSSNLSGQFRGTAYHSTFDSADLVDWALFGRGVKFIDRLVTELDSGVLPWSLGMNSDDLASAFDAPGLIAAGANAALVQRMATDVASFGTAAKAFDARRSSFGAKHWDSVNRSLLDVEHQLGTGLTALDAWDGTVYPHEQVYWDIQGLTAAIDALQPPQPNADDALSALDGVGVTYTGENFSYAVYRDELSRHAPGYPRLGFANLGHLAPFLDVMPQWRQIENGDYSVAVAGLSAMRAKEVRQLNGRLAAIADILEEVTPQITALR